MNKLHTTSVILALAASAGLYNANAATRSFDFKDPKGVNNLQFHLDAPLEAISGSANGIAGTIAFDPTDPATTTGRIVVETASLTVGNPLMKEHLHGTNWLDVAQHPEITFEATKVANVKSEGEKTTADVTGKLTVKGTTREVTLPVTFTHIPGKLGARLGKPELGGDLLVVRSSFSISRSEFGIMPGKVTDKVSETIELNFSIAGGAPAS